MINYYLFNATYQNGGRGPLNFDCWGLVREVRYRVCGKALLPEWGAVGFSKLRENTLAYTRKSPEMRRCTAPEPGAIAAAFRGRLCVHVGVVLSVDGQLSILEINPGQRAKLVDPRRFAAAFDEVRYYND
ncbi:hypothetical protein D3C77_106000 [compost metagenome]